MSAQNQKYIKTPIISVMIPTWNPQPNFLREAVDSVLMQDWGPLKMQIAVVDDCSTEVDVKELLQSWDYLNRIEFYQNESNRGIGGNWNSCIERSRGEYLHILHQDDLVVEGFYVTLIPALESHVNIGFAFSRVEYWNISQLPNTFSRIEMLKEGLIDDFLYRVHESDIQCPGVIIRKSTISDLGKFKEDLVYALDKEMWARISSKYQIWYTPKPMAIFRRHGNSASDSIAEAKAGQYDVLKAAEYIWSYMNDEIRKENDQKKLKKKIVAQLIDQKTKRHSIFSLLELAPYPFTIKKYLTSLF